MTDSHGWMQDQIGDMKVKYNTPDLVKDLPPQFLAFMKHLKNLNYADRPDYNHLYSLLLEVYHAQGCDDNTPFDWEVGAPLRSPQYPATPLVSSTQEVEFSRDHKSNAPLNPHSRAATLEDEVGSPNTMSPQQSQHSQPNHANNYNNNSPNHHSRRDSASVIAASTSSEGKQTGSWEKKSSPQATAMPALKTEDSHLKVTPAKAKSPTTDDEKAEALVPPAEGSAKPKPAKSNAHKSNKSGSCHCIIL